MKLCTDPCCVLCQNSITKLEIPFLYVQNSIFGIFECGLEKKLLNIVRKRHLYFSFYNFMLGVREYNWGAVPRRQTRGRPDVKDEGALCRSTGRVMIFSPSSVRQHKLRQRVYLLAPPRPTSCWAGASAGRSGAHLWSREVIKPLRNLGCSVVAHYTGRVHGRAAQVWQATRRHELERRREQRSQRHRGLLRTVMPCAGVGGAKRRTGRC